MSASAVRTLLAGAIDYAGLFPPAALAMGEAVRNYAAYRSGDDAWALGRFVVPIARLTEFRACAAPLLSALEERPWRLSVLAGDGGADEWEGAGRLDLDGAAIDAIELRARTTSEVHAAATRLPADLDAFFEIPIDPDPGDLVDAVGRVSARAKVRTGGVTASAFPRAADLARFIVACARAGVAFKATAGLHHALRATYRLTYDAGSASGEMFGFLNVLLAAALARAGRGEGAVMELLAERDPAAIRFGADSVGWRGETLRTDELRLARHTLMLSFGSCSFREPIEELEALGLL